MDTEPESADGSGAPSVVIGVSIAVPDPFGKEIQDARDSYGDPLARSIPTHVTLLPPTEIPVDRLPVIQRHLHDVAARHRGFRMLLLGTGTFRPVSPVVFLCIEEGMQECREVESAVRSGPLARSLNFPYHPHVTVVHNLTEPVLDRAYEEMRGFRAGFAVPGFSLYRFGADGVWRPLHAYPFGS